MRYAGEKARQIALWMKEQSDLAGAKGGVFGVSGGVDSALLVPLAQTAWAENCLGLVLPCHSMKEDVDDAVDVLEHFGCKYQILDLTPIYETFKRVLPHNTNGGLLSDANLKPRIRMTVLYYYASLMKYVVVGTTNKAERYVGYFTKHGDGGVDLQPLGDLTKEEVKALSRYFGVPERIIEKAPSGGLWEGQTDEEEMGVTYQELDGHLNGKEVPEEALEMILRMHRQSEHKRQLPPIPCFTEFKEE